MAISPTSPLISVIVPTHGRRELLLRLLQSLEQQSLDKSRFEIIVVHNHTDDGTEEAVAEWAKRDDLNIRYYRRNFKGPTRSRDLGAREAAGRYLAFIDDDCVASERWLSSGIDAFESASGVDRDAAPDTNAPARSAIGVVQGRTLPLPGQPRHLLEKTIEIRSLTSYFETCNIFYSREAFDAVDGFSPEFLDEFYGEDTDLGWKVKRAGFEVAFAADALAYHEVFRVTAWQWLREPMHFRNIPYLARKFPELRSRMTAGIFLLKDTMYFYPFLLGLAAIAWSPVGGVALMAPYVVYRYGNSPRIRNPLLRLVRVLAGIPRTTVMCVALVRGSFKARSLLL